MVAIHRCVRCGLVLEGSAWRDLELVERIACEKVRELVTGWPDDTAIEARKCTCGHVIARKAERPDLPRAC
jgi:hypothetical protein